MKYDALGYYNLLEVSPHASEEQIKQSYRDLAKFWHPDHNSSENAIDKFQKLSVAYDVLKDRLSRLNYDLLSMVYDANEYPEYETIAPFSDIIGDADIRAFSVYYVRGLLWKYSQRKEVKILSYGNAFGFMSKTALGNWLLGWWHPLSFIKNIQALRWNYSNSFSKQDTFRILVHNIVAYHKNGNLPLAVTSATVAREYAEPEEKTNLNKFIELSNLQIKRLPKWNIASLKLAQLVFPIIVAVSIILFSYGNAPQQLKNWWGDSEEISYYQEVDTGYQNRTVDDVVVGKIHNIPVNKRDLSHLYHLRQDSVIMYGPSDNFDIMKKQSAMTTVRLTGYSPDNVWARILIDNGEMGFVRMDSLEKGIGKEIPFGSAVYEE